MNKILYSIIVLTLTACTPVQIPVTHQYQLQTFNQNLRSHALHSSLLISQPEALAGYQTEAMLYVNKPYELSTFAHNAWVNPPANMLYPLLIQTVQNTHAFHAVASSPYADHVDYRLDTQLLAMQQNFLIKPSRFEMKLQAVVTRVTDNHVLASRLFTAQVPCKEDTPYGGVMAANQASWNMTREIAQFVIQSVEHDHKDQHILAK